MDGKRLAALALRKAFWHDLSAPANKYLEAADMEAEIAEADARYAAPPCFECGATSAEDAQDKCICGGDKDDCHGTKLWPDAA